MVQKTKIVALKNTFGDVVRIKPERLAYFAVWDQGQHINFWDRNHCIGDLRFTPDTFDNEAELVFQRLQTAGLDFLRLSKGEDPDDAGSNDHYRFFYRPNAIEFFEDDISPHTKKWALSIEGVSFFMDEGEKADFKHRLMSLTPKDDWLEFSKDLGTEFNCASGHYAFRKSMVTNVFANAKDKLLAVETLNQYRSFVPMEQPQNVIDAVTKTLPQLVKSDAPATAYPLYYAPAIYPPGKRHHVNIILRR